MRDLVDSDNCALFVKDAKNLFGKSMSRANMTHIVEEAIRCILPSVTYSTITLIAICDRMVTEMEKGLGNRRRWWKEIRFEMCSIVSITI